ncbi:MAG: 16S rRNA (uracil(1498)-N(3))-methyltransferase [Candidatus Schekmanbacteria bacterium]|nr:16S rRNA (uracil(1498)-N(3))-methyltransferase [Candidatus Schekmanbacteria bacterium]
MSRLPRIPLPDGVLPASGRPRLLPEDEHHLRAVLRIRPGSRVCFFTAAGCEIEATVTCLSPLTVAPVGARELDTEPAAVVVLHPTVLRPGFMSMIMEKATELGAVAVEPIVTEWSVAASARGAEKEVRRWERIAREAVKQCGRSRAPRIACPEALEACLRHVPPRDLLIVLHPAAGELPPAAPDDRLAAILGESGLRLFIGPEGGFSSRDIALLAAHGAVSWRLGPRILRAETAAVAGLAILQRLLGNL